MLHEFMGLASAFAPEAQAKQMRDWQDADGDGGADAGELRTLAEAGVQSIHTAYTESSSVDSQGNAHRQIEMAAIEGANDLEWRYVA